LADNFGKITTKTMAKKYFVVHFSGHGDLRKVGLRHDEVFNYLAPLLSLGDVSRFSFWSGLGKKSSEEVAANVFNIMKGYAGGDITNVTFIIHGYSAGGITALHFATLVPDSQISYIALSDAAFYKGDTDYLMTSPGKFGRLNENYYQTLENKPTVSEIHNKVLGYTNIEVTGLSRYSFKSYHDQAVGKADILIFDKMKNIISADK
jgi:hypothetical protein